MRTGWVYYVRRVIKSWLYRAVPIIVGACLLFVSWRLGERWHWWSDALMTVGASLALVSPLLWITKGMEAKTTKKIDDLRHEVEEDVASLRRSVSDSQKYVLEKLRERRSEQETELSRFLQDPTRENVLACLKLADSLGLLSKVGVRGSSPVVDLDVRLQLVRGEEVRLFLDYRDHPGVQRITWRTGVTFEELMLQLAAAVQQTSYWPGEGLWNFEGALRGIADVFTTALWMRANGNHMTNVVQVVGKQWIISDHDIKSVEVVNPYQIAFDRLDELDWEEHLSGKGWVDETHVYEMLEAAKVIRGLVGHAR